MAEVGSRIAKSAGVGQRMRSCVIETQREVGISRIERQQIVVQEVFRGKAEFELLVLGNREALLRRQIAVPVHGTVEARHTGIADPRALHRVSEAIWVGKLVFLQSNIRIAGEHRSYRYIRRTDTIDTVRAGLELGDSGELVAVDGAVQ